MPGAAGLVHDDRISLELDDRSSLGLILAVNCQYARWILRIDCSLAVAQEEASLHSIPPLSGDRVLNPHGDRLCAEPGM